VASYGSPVEQPPQPDAPVAPPPDVELPTLEEMIELYEAAAEAAVENNKLCRRDRDFYDGNQWSEDELAKLAETNQPPAVKNRIAKKINFTLGEEIAKRIAPTTKPRTPKHEDDHRAMTGALRYVSDDQRFDQVRSAVFKDMLIYGLGASLKSYDRATGKHALTHVLWDRYVRDPHARTLNCSDALHHDIVVWMDIAEALRKFPDAKAAIKNAVGNDSAGNPDSTTDDAPRKWIDRKRQRVKVVEHYQLVGEDWYCASIAGRELVKKPERTDIMDEKGEHSVCPVVVAVCYLDQDGNPYGLVRGLISGQEWLNKLSSKVLYQLSVKNVIAERDLIRNPKRFMQNLAKPDGYNEVEPGALQEGRILIQTGTELAGALVNLMEQAKQDIDTIGPSASMLPGAPATSGREVLARSKAASQELGSAFDSLREWSLANFVLDWLCIKWNWTDEKWLRVTDDNETSGYKFVGLNRQMPRAERLQELLGKDQPMPLPRAIEIAAGDDGKTVLAQATQILQAQAQRMGQQPGQQQDPKQAEQQVLALVMRHPLMTDVMTVANNVAEMDIDVVLDDAPDVRVLAEEQFETLSAMAPAMMQARQDMAPKIVRMMIQASSLPDKREIMAEWDKPPDPQAQQMQQAQQQLAIQQLQQQVALLTAQVTKTNADAQLSAAKAQAEMVEMQRPVTPDAPEMPSPLEHAKAQREQVNTQLDVEKTRAHLERDSAMTQKYKVDTMAAAKQMMQPPAAPGEQP
jgi:hypothetical protein